MSGWRIVLWVTLVLIGLLFLYLVRGVLLPFLLSFIIAALLEPAVRKLRLRGLSKGASVGVVFTCFTLFFVLLGGLVVPTLIRESANLRQEVSSLLADWTREDPNENFFVRWQPDVMATQPTKEATIDRLLVPYRDTLAKFGLPSTQRDIFNQYIEPERPKIAAAVQGAVLSFFGLFSSIFSQIFFVVLIPILVPLILMEYDEYRRSGPRWIPPAIRQGALTMMNEIGQVFFRYLRGIALVVILYTVAQTLVLLLFGVPYALLLGPIFGALYLIPYIGNLISAVALFVLVGFSNVTGNFAISFASPWAYALLVTGLYLAVGWIFDHLIYPQMVGNSVGLSPVVSMFVIFAGGALFGLPGMLIAFPLAGSVKVVLDRLIKVTSSTGEGLGLPTVPLRHRTTV